MECFRIDESGYTGFDLLNADQRFQGAAAIAISDQDAARLIREHFPKLQATELKYRALSRRPANHPRLLSLQRDLLTHYKCVTYVCDKRFLLLLMFVDYAVEPFYYEKGINFYEDGQNYAMASLLSQSPVQTLLGQPAFDGLLGVFPTRGQREDAGSSERSRLFCASDEVARISRGSWTASRVRGPLNVCRCRQPGVNTDAALVVLQSLISRMEVMADGPYRVEHDQSKNLLTYHDLLQRFIDHDQEIEFRQTEIATISSSSLPRSRRSTPRQASLCNWLT